MGISKSMKHGAGVIVIREDGAVLLQRRDNRSGVVNPGLWSFPGGAVQENETYTAAARRELQEESGYVAGTLFFVVEEEYERTDGERIVRHIYWTPFDQTQAIACHEGAEIRFVHLEELPAEKIVPGHKKIIQRALDAKNAVGQHGN